MSKIIYYPDVLNKQTFSDVSFEDWFSSLKAKPRNIRIFLNDISEENDISEAWVENESLLEDPDATYHVIVIPHGPIGKVFKILSPITNFLFKFLMPKIPSVATTRQTSSNNSLTARSNEPRLGSRIADIRGTVRSVPDLLMDYKIFRGGTEFEVELLCGSVGQVEDSDFRDGDTPFGNITGSVLNKYEPYSSPGNGSPSLTIGGTIDTSIYPIMIAIPSNEIDGPELKPPNYYVYDKLTMTFFPNGNITVPNDPDDDDYREVDFTIILTVGGQITLTGCYAFVETTTGSGIYTRYDINGVRTVTYLDTFTVGIAPVPAGWSSLPSAGFTMVSSARLQTDGTWRLTGSTGTLVSFVPTLTPVQSYLVGPYSLQSAPEIMINLVAANGLYKQDDNVLPISIDCVVFISNADNTADPTLTYNMTITGRDTDSTGQTLRITNPYPNNCLISMRRFTYTDKDFSGSVVDEVKWRDLYSVTPVGAQNYGNVTLYHTLTRATDAALRLKERKLNMTSTRIANGAASNLISDVVISMHTDPYFGRRTVDTLDLESLNDAMNAVASYYGIEAIQVGYTYDEDNVTYEESLKNICSVASINPIQIGNIISFWADLPQSASSMQFGHVSKVPNSDKRNRTFKAQRGYTGVKVTYFDFNKRSFEDYQEGENTNLLKIDNIGFISLNQATWRAKKEFAKLNYQRIVHTFDALAVGLQCIPGMRVDVIDNTRNLRNEGFIVDQNGLTLTLSDPIATGLDENYTIVLTKRNGSIQSMPITIVDEYTIVLSQAPSEAVYTGFRQDRTAYNIATDDQKSSIAMLITDVNPNNNDGVYTVGITAINYSDQYWPK